eukprot:366360-Chlamydomonas_euryale.AAC.11
MYTVASPITYSVQMLPSAFCVRRWAPHVSLRRRRRQHRVRADARIHSGDLPDCMSESITPSPLRRSVDKYRAGLPVWGRAAASIARCLASSSRKPRAKASSVAAAAAAQASAAAAAAAEASALAQAQAAAVTGRVVNQPASHATNRGSVGVGASASDPPARGGHRRGGTRKRGGDDHRRDWLGQDDAAFAGGAGQRCTGMCGGQPKALGWSHGNSCGGATHETKRAVWQTDIASSSRLRSGWLYPSHALCPKR